MSLLCLSLRTSCAQDLFLLYDLEQLVELYGDVEGRVGYGGKLVTACGYPGTNVEEPRDGLSKKGSTIGILNGATVNTDNPLWLQPASSS